MEFYPTARRVLLTAYADTSAAIDAVNVVDLDHYLLKPWNPPEELLYPILDELLDGWESPGARLSAEMRVVGHRWSARSASLRDFLTRNQASYRWYTAEEEDSQRLLAAAGVSSDRFPVVVRADGHVLVDPTDAEVAEQLGLNVRPALEVYDLVVVGAGPAGLGTAVYGGSEGLNTLLVERSAAGGQAGQNSRIENYLGFPDGISGAQLTQRANRQAAKFGTEVFTTREVVGIETSGAAHTVRFSDNTSVAAHAIILATGVSYRQLSAEGLAGLTGRGVYYGGTPRQADDCAGQAVFIVGGANSAGQAAMHFARRSESVSVLVRGPSLASTMSHYLVEQIAETPNITVRSPTEIVAADGSEHLQRLTLHDRARDLTEEVDAEWVFIFIGADPRTEWLSGIVARDKHGFVLAGPDLTASVKGGSWPLERVPYHLETCVPGIFVAGDARSQSGKRVAAAVGEGAMAVMLVHRYLDGS
jgi:thioredoxin reductase (NADPH)